MIWHPGDAEGQQVFDWIFEHFHGTSFSGLIGGAVEVYLRTDPWDGSGAPRPLPVTESLPANLLAARVTVAVPVIGREMCRALAVPDSPWSMYCQTLASLPINSSFGLFALRVGSADSNFQTPFAQRQALAKDSSKSRAVLCRELSQQIVQLTNGDTGNRLRVFISHTKHSLPGTADPVTGVVAEVRTKIGDTHLQPYFDQQDVQPGVDWAEELIRSASTSALLAVRTDLYAGREWCQKEFLLAKQNEMPVVTLNAVEKSEERGSFILDHVPVVGYRAGGTSIEEALNLLVDGALRRALWKLCLVDLKDHGFDWMPLHAPEPVTLIPWLLENRSEANADGLIRIIHPDPPLQPDEESLIRQILELAGMSIDVEIVTPRTYASRGGGMRK